MIKSTHGEMIGAYLAGDWAERRGGSRSKYFGTGESFVCKFNPSPVKFSWVGIAGGDNINVGPSKVEEEHEVTTRFSGIVGEVDGKNGGGGVNDDGGGLNNDGGGVNNDGSCFMGGGNVDGDIDGASPPPSTTTNAPTPSLTTHRMITSMFATGDATSISIGGG